MRQAVVVLCVLLCCLASGCGGRGGNKFHYPAVVRDSFMKSCTNGIQQRKAYCGCTLDKLSETVSTQDFTRIGNAGGRISPRIQRLIQKAAVACANKL